MPTSILVTGANGQVGQELAALAGSYPFDFLFTDRSTLDIADREAVEAYTAANPIDVIINCAAYTAVDKAETETDAAMRINAEAVGNLVAAANRNNALMCHISTDFVYDGEKPVPYEETDGTNPLSVYGTSKLEGEKLVTRDAKRYLILRTSWVYSTFGNNFVKTMQRLGRERDELGVIFDQAGTPTYARDLARTILDIVQKEMREPLSANQVYHYSNEGVTSWFDFAKAVMELSGIECRIQPIRTEAYPTPAKRPCYSVMDKTKIKNAYSIEIPYWRDSLKECITAMKETN